MSICLNMIVRNEEHVIERCLKSVLPFITHYCIADTGSQDRTRQVIKDTLDPHISGHVFRDTWHDFAYNRNLVLTSSLGKADWILTIDADEVFSSKGLPEIKLDPEFNSYICLNKGQGYEFWRRRIVKNDGSYHYVNKIHELLAPKEGTEEKNADLHGFWFEDLGDGARSKSGIKFLQDLIALENEHKADPNNPRTVFYLAQTYHCIASYSKATEFYLKRVEMGGWEEEVYFSKLQLARMCFRHHNRLSERCIALYMDAYVYRPGRLEALAELCEQLRHTKDWATIYTISKGKRALSNDILFVDAEAERKVGEEYALSAFYLGKVQEAKTVFEYILKTYILDTETRSRIEKNLTYC